MKRLSLAAACIAAVLAVGCTRKTDALEIPIGTDVSVEKRDGVTVAGRLVEVQAKEVVLESPAGQRTRVPRAEIATVRAVNPPVPATPSSDSVAPAVPARDDLARSADAKPAPETKPVDAPEYRQVTVPAGTILPVELRTSVGSATSNVDDPVRGTVQRTVMVDGVGAIPSGSVVLGTVTEAARSARVKGRARVAFRFSSLDTPGDSERVKIRTGSVAREAQPTKKRDAATIGGGAAAGAIIGGVVGGGDGAAKGAAIGGGAGTGVVLSTRGKEITLPAGTAVSVKLLEPVTLRVRVK